MLCVMSLILEVTLKNCLYDLGATQNDALGIFFA